MSKLLIVDMNNMFWRAFHGLKMQNLRTERGEPTWAVFGSLNTVTSLIREHNPSHVLLAWDKGQSAYRNSVYPEYKGTRVSSSNERDRDPEVDFQFKLTRDLLDKMSLFSYSENQTEADDVIATTVYKFCDEIDIVIVSSDHDVRQLIRNERVTVVKPSLNTTRAPEEVFTYREILADYGIVPPRLPEIWALHGDSSDNVPGAAGVGPKTAFKLISEFGTLDRVLASGNKKIVGQESIVRRAFELIELRGDVARCEYKLDELEFKPEVDLQLIETLKRYEFNSILTKLELDMLWKQVNVRTRSLSE
jgi:DNA polymerase-1